MDFTSALKPDVFRSFAIYICPGVIAISPWMFCIFWPDQLPDAIWRASPIGAISLLLFVGLCAGLILEDIGSRIEGIVDEQNGVKNPEFGDTFWSYIRSSSSRDLVAHGYLSAIVTRFKFELSMIPAVLCAMTGVVVANCTNRGFEVAPAEPVVLVCIVLAYYLYLEAIETSRLLHIVRGQIIKAKLSKPEA